MIEQQANRITLTFPTPDSATTFATFLQSLLTVTASPQLSQPGAAISSPPFESPLGIKLAPGQPPTQGSPELKPSLLPDQPQRLPHTVLTPERQDAIANQRANGLTTHQRLLRAQTTLRDGVLPFSRPGQAPPPTGQPSPRQKAALEGGFADGQPGTEDGEIRRCGRQAPCRRQKRPGGTDAAVVDKLAHALAKRLAVSRDFDGIHGTGLLLSR